MRGFLILALALGSLGDWDSTLVRWVQERRQPWLDPVMNGVTRAGNAVTVMGGLLIVAVGHHPGGVPMARVGLAALVGANLSVETLKLVTHRTRPDGRGSRGNSSFPSSHAANAFAIACIVANRWRRPRLLWWLMAALVGFSRIYLNRHYPSDVLVGALLGTVIAMVALRNGEWLQQHWPGRRRRQAE